MKTRYVVLSWACVLALLMYAGQLSLDGRTMPAMLLTWLAFFLAGVISINETKGEQK